MGITLKNIRDDHLIQFICLVLALFIIVGLTPTYVEAVNPTIKVKYSNESYKKEWEQDLYNWWQGRIPNTGSETISNKTEKTIGRAACSSFAFSYMLVKLGYLNPSTGDTPYTHIVKAREKNAFIDGWYYDFSTCGSLYPGLSYAGRVELTGKTNEDCFSIIKGAMESGKFVVAIVRVDGGTTGHCIFIDGFTEDGDMVIGDSAYNGKYWSDYYGTVSTHFKYMETVTCSGKTPSNTGSIYSTVNLSDVNGNAAQQGSGGNGSMQQSSNLALYLSAVEETELKGLNQPDFLASLVEEPVIVDDEILSYEERFNVSHIREDINVGKVTVEDIAVITSRIVGMIMVTYSILLVVGYIFDRVSIFFDISVVSLLTLGNIKVVDERELASEKRGRYRTISFFVFVGVMLVVGLWITSSGLLKLIYRLL